MSRLRLLLLVAGLGALMISCPVSALVTPGPKADALPTATPVNPALTLLESAVTAARVRTWSGTQHVVTTRSGEPHLAVLQVRHTPGEGSTVQVLSSEAAALAPDVLDQSLLSLLASHYDLRMAGAGACAGHRARVVEALRPGQSGPMALAGRFWVDDATGLVLRRDVLDDGGLVVRSSAFVSLTVGSRDAVPVSFWAAPPMAGVMHATGQRLDDTGVQVLVAQGWPISRDLPAGMDMFEARMHDSALGDVLQLSYSDGLSTLSLFVQKGELPSVTPGIPQSLGGQVWVSPGTTERVVWSGGGRTWTLVSDAPDATVQSAVLALPHAPAEQDDGMFARTWRGMSRVGAWLNPFD